MTSKKMNDFEKAKAVIIDKNNSLIDISKKYSIPYQTLKNWRANPESLKKAAWERVHLLAVIYDKIEGIKDRLYSDRGLRPSDDLYKAIDKAVFDLESEEEQLRDF
ncbi:hypothetical protein AAA431_10985 [Lactobacillus crispatus]|uniref:hypothetical protein n=1 Tax=Lactobacillus crispatus TaxID=47770 RepID=UPI0030F4F88A